MNARYRSRGRRTFVGIYDTDLGKRWVLGSGLIVNIGIAPFWDLPLSEFFKGVIGHVRGVCERRLFYFVGNTAPRRTGYVEFSLMWLR